MRVPDTLRQILFGCSAVVHAFRLRAMLAAATALIRIGRVSPAALGRGLGGRTLPKHSIKRIDRLLGNWTLWAERHIFWEALAHYVLRGDRWRRTRHLRSRPRILVDWTKAVGGLNALAAAVPIGGRALTIYAEIHPLKMLGNARVHARFLRNLRDILPPGLEPIVVTDAGFHGPFFREVRKLGWHFVGRVRGTAAARPLEGGPSITKDQFYAKATLVPRDLGFFNLYSSAESVTGRLIVVRNRRKGRKLPPTKCKEQIEARKSAKDPWLLVTSLPDEDAAQVTAIYALRMQIEETFRDAKNHRFGWSLHHIRSRFAQRITILLLLTSLAMIAVTLVGFTAERLQLHRSYQANTETKRVLSFFVLGIAVIARNDRRVLVADKLKQGLHTLRATALCLENC
jgi:hypothetical protein